VCTEKPTCCEENAVPRSAPLSGRLRRTPVALVLAAALALLTACGGSDDDDGGDAAAPATSSSPATSSAATSSAAEDTGSETSSSAPAEEGGGALTVTGVDFGYELDSTELAAGDYEVTFANEGGATHNVIVEQDGEDVGGSDTIGPGESTTFTITLEPGEYVFYCSVGNHRAMGMEMTVTVT
jgi:plastocyanin